MLDLSWSWCAMNEERIGKLLEVLAYLLLRTIIDLYLQLSCSLKTATKVILVSFKCDGFWNRLFASSLWLSASSLCFSVRSPNHHLDLYIRPNLTFYCFPSYGSLHALVSWYTKSMNGIWWDYISNLLLENEAG